MRNIKNYLPRYLIFGLLIYLTVNTIQAQNVSVQDRQFKIGANNYNPMFVNYSIEAIKFNGTSTYYISAMHSYGNTNDFEGGNNILTYNQQLLSDFNRIASMGFNGIREVGFCPKYLNGLGLYFYFAKVNNSGVYVGYDSLALHPNVPNDPGMQTILPLFDSILTIASLVPDTFKVIILMTGNKSNYNTAEVAAWSEYLDTLSEHFHTSIHNDELFAYDLMNEPAYHDLGNKSKEQVCELVRNWYDIAKANDPDHLITLGHSGYVDVFKYDPTVLKLDFLSLHYYPLFAPYENRSLQSTQLLARKRTLNDLYWMKKNSPMPWIIGETGLAASGTYSIAQGLNGTLADQDSFARFSLNKFLNYGASGFSWWTYQDVYFYNLGSPSFNENFFGLVNRGCGYPSAPSYKPAKNEFVNFTWGATGQGNTPPYYYDPQNWDSLSNYSYPKTLTGTVVEDISGNPIEDAYIGAWIKFQMVYNGPIDSTKATHTFSHSNGTYSLNPKYPYSYLYSSDYRFIGIAAAGANTLWPIGTIPHAPLWQCDTFLTYFPFKYDLAVNNEIVTFGYNRNFQGWGSLTVNTLANSNVIVDSGAVSEFKARDSVVVNGNFTAEFGSDVYIYCTTTFPECKDFINLKSMRANNPVSDETQTDDIENEKQMDVNFIPITKYAFLDIFPNPGNGLFTLNLKTNKDDNLLLQINVYDITGSCVFKDIIIENISNLDLSFLSKGIYYLHASTKDDSFNQKLIIK